MTSDQHRLALPARRLWRTEGSPWPRRGQRCGPAGRDRGLLRGQPHFPGRRHLLRTLPGRPQGQGAADLVRGRRLSSRAQGAVLPAGRLQCGADAVRRPARGRKHQHRGPDPGAARRRRRQGTGVPQRGSGAVPLPGQETSRARVPHLQRVHRRAAGALRRPLLRCRADQLVGSARHPTDAGRAEIVGAQDVPDAAEPGQGRRRQPDRLREHRHERRLGRDRGLRPAGHAPHRRNPAEEPVRVQQRRRRHDDQHRRIPGDVLQVHLRRHPRPAPGAADRLVRGRDRLGCRGRCRTPSTWWRPISTCSTGRWSTTCATTGTTT